MATKEQMKFYNEDKYWNMDLKEDFMANTRTLWKGNFSNKKDGSIFSFEAVCTPEEHLTVSPPFFLIVVLDPKSGQRNGCSY